MPSIASMPPHWPPGATAMVSPVNDPDGSNIEAFYHGPIERSAASVIITRVKV